MPAMWKGRARCNEIGSSLHRHAVPRLDPGIVAGIHVFPAAPQQARRRWPQIKSGGDKPGHDSAKVTQRDRNAERLLTHIGTRASLAPALQASPGFMPDHHNSRIMFVGIVTLESLIFEYF